MLAVTGLGCGVSFMNVFDIGFNVVVTPRRAELLQDCDLAQGALIIAFQVQRAG